VSARGPASLSLAQLRRQRLRRDFYTSNASDLAKALLGCIFVRRVSGIVRRARIVEAEAYLGPKDLASHSSKGRTGRTEIMFGPPGHAYVYFIYGMHFMFNVVSGVEGEAHAVLIRAAEPLDGWDATLIGPGLFARAFEIARPDNGIDLTRGETFFVADDGYTPRIVKSKRVGVDYAERWKDRLLRFIDVKNPVAKKLRW
jgi:DNA-3-methyladenine glycosylase